MSDSRAPSFGPNTPTLGGGMPWRMECDLHDCDVEGTLPPDLEGGFYRVGPDFQYPPAPGNIPFDGEGHVSVFRFHDGHVHFRSRFVRTQRFKVQEAAGRGLFGVYRNRLTDDPAVAGVSRGTANTALVHHAGKLLALKEDSPPVVLDPVSLATLDDYHTFGGGLRSLTFTAHPKIDSATGQMIGFGYEARGDGSDDVAIQTIDAHGHLVSEAWIKVPYVGMLHDFAVTERHIAFLCIPMATNLEQMRRGGVHFAWDRELPTWLGVMRRDGDGRDIRWFRGPERCATHVMGAFSDGDRVYIDMDMALQNQFPFFPNLHGEPFDPAAAAGRLTRLSVDVSGPQPAGFDMQILFGETGVLPRQDDRYQTHPYSVGFMPCLDPLRPFDERLRGLPFRPNNTYVRFDHRTGRSSTFFAGSDTGLQECCFVPRGPAAAEGDGYLVGIASRLLEGGRSDLLILDAQRPQEGPIATVRLPVRLNAQVHGWWVPGPALHAPAPAAAAARP